MLTKYLNVYFGLIIQEAKSEPELANLNDLWQGIEVLLEQLPDHQRLTVAGRAIAELAEICELRATRMLDDWDEERNVEDGPLLDVDFLNSLTQQTMHLDISALTRQPKKRKRESKKPAGDSPVVQEIDKARLLELADLQEAKRQALTVSHDENVSAWAEAIAAWIEQQPNTVSLQDLQQATGMPLVQVWLALLLGSNYSLKQTGEFYDCPEKMLIDAKV